MVIYVKEWNGKKKTVGLAGRRRGSPTVATLPDLSQMESITYVNEIDVRKIASGQPVVLTLDSDPEQEARRARSRSVANVGEQRPNTDAKVFEVKVLLIEQADTTLRPGMTTGNAVETLRKSRTCSTSRSRRSTARSGVPFVYRQDGARRAQAGSRDRRR